MKKLLSLNILYVLLFGCLSVHAQLYWRTDGVAGTLTASTWGTSGAGPFTNAWVDNSNIFITGSIGNTITNVTNTPVGNITITGSSTTNWGSAGTFNTNGNISTIDIGGGSLLTWNSQPVSTAVGTGFIKNGTGTWNIGSQPNLFTGGFTLNTGTVVVGGDNALGGGIFYLNGGTIQSSSTRTMAVSSIVVGGDFEHTGSGNATWGMNVSLGAATRSILNTTASGSRRYTGIVSGNAGAGLTFNGTGLAQFYFGNTTNSFSGPVTINGGEVVFDDDGSFGATTSITIDGGRLSIGMIDAAGTSSALTNATINATRTVYVGSGALTSISVLGSTGVTFMDAVITDKPLTTGSWSKQGGGRLTIGSACTYTGSTSINNGTIRIRNADNRLPVSTILYLGQASNTNLGTFDLNDHNQQVAGLYSVTGINASVSKNTITSATTGTLTVTGSGNYGAGTAANSGVITGATSLVKSGSGTLALGDANTYTGSTTVSGGTLQLIRTGGTTIPAAANVTVSGGTLQISSDQALNNVSVTSGTLLIDTGVTLTINGTYSGGGTITNNGTIIINAVNNFPGVATTITAGFNNLQINAAVNMDNSLAINGSLTLNAGFAIGSNTLTLNGPAIAGTATNLSSTASSSLVFGGSSSSVFIPPSITQLSNLTNNNSIGVSINSILSVFTSVLLNSGLLTIAAGNKLDVNGASLTGTSGYLAGTSTSDLSVVGTTGGTVNLPTNANILLRNITISGTRVVKMNGTNNILLSGLLSIAATATYDNGGETQIINNTGGSISITGRFITRDIQGFFAANAAIPAIPPTLNAGCTIEYALTGNQAVQGSTVSYRNVTFSGSGIKTLASTTSPNGTVYITGTAIVQTNGFNFGGALTALTMDGGRLIVTTTGTQPAMLGTYTLTGGVVEFNGSSNQTVRTQTYQNIEVTGIGVGNSSGNITLRDNGTFTVTSTGVFLINDNTIIGITPATGTQTITVQSGGVFRSGNNEGFNGFTSTLSTNSSVHSNITNINLMTGSKVEYMRNGDQPITNANGLQYYHLLISGTTGIKSAPSGSLIIKGNITKTGAAQFNANYGIVYINGTSAQLYTSTAPVMEFNNLSLNNASGFSTASDMSIDGELSFGANAKLSLQAGYISLKSFSTRTANVGVIPSTASISYSSNTGFIIERYIATGSSGGQHTKGWQFLTVPVNNGQTVNASWQEAATVYTDNFNPGYGTQITSNLAGAISLGFDSYSGGGSSMKTYNSSGSGTWDGIPNTNSYPVYNAKGYMIFIRGDRSVYNFSGANSSPLSTTLRASGKIFAPGSNPPSSITVAAGKFESVGNPYASAIDLTYLNTLSTGDVQNIFYVWDPQLTTAGPNSAYGYGGYRTLTPNGTDYDVTPAGGSYGATTKYIQSGQAFFVKSLSTGGTVNFSENCKVSSSALVTRSAGISNVPKFKANLSVISNGSTVLLDGTMITFGDHILPGLNVNDAVKITQSGESMSIYYSRTRLTVESRNFFTHSDTVEYRLDQLKQRTYQFEFIPENINQPGLSAYLDDQFLHLQTAISLLDTTHILFVTNAADPLSMSASRFRVVFKKDRSWLPGIYTDADTNGKGDAGETYNKDSKPVTAKGNSSMLQLYPNPVIKGNVTLHFIDPEKGNYRINVINSMGIVVYQADFFINVTTTKAFKMPDLPSAEYQVVVITPQKEIITQQALITN